MRQSILIVIGLLMVMASYAQKPNILLIMADDHANRTISAYDDGINQTPNIDRIANEGAIFFNSYCANSICQPSRAAILTGKHSHKNGVYGNGSPYDNTQQQLPRILQNNGYTTAVIGKWHLKGEDPGDAFDYWNILTEGGGQGYYYNPTFKAQTGATTQVEGYSTDVITDQSLTWLDDNKDVPFCLMVHYKAPHVTRMPMARNLELYEDETIPEPETLYDDYSTREKYASTAINRLRFDIESTAYNYFPKYGEYNLAEYKLLERMTEEQRKAYHAYYDAANAEYDALVASGQVVPGEKSGKAYAYQRFIKDYLKVVAGVDQNVKRILDYLDTNGLTDNTIVIYCGDQSYFTGQHGYYEKRFIYEDGMKMPLLMRYPNHIMPDTKVQEFVQNIDFAPTLLDYLDINIPGDMQGESFKNVVEGNVPSDWRDAVYYHYYDHGKHGIPRHEGVRTSQYKLINFYTDDAWELYDLVNDPHEVNNVYKNEAYADVVKALKLKLASLKQQYEVPGADVIAEDFEGGLYKNNQAKLNWQLQNSAGSAYRVVNNPDNSDANASLNTGRIVRNGATTATTLSVNLGDQFWDLMVNRYLSLKVRSDISTDIQIALSKDGSDVLVKKSTVTGNAGWSEIRLDFSDIPYASLQNTYNQLSIIMGATTPNADGTIWFDELTFVDNLSTDIKNIGTEQGYFYPNPTNGDVSIKGLEHVASIEVYALNGALVAVERGANISQLSLNNLNNGTYLLRAITETGISKIGKVTKI
ncbi:sulfatase-like hydrolase/transferase [Carboxylicivirga mesophila]|uniref:Sulfatase-like hydrolase/transferase n=1 Tax=Carboxylicivirga mesophila TaxID=1166478 RepID=A0ABS5K5J7_9BACT|nr:sulfatase/phosphatase domain-containing protein [Carboxylicivirga mesophila]MBS2210269.1 sulfatase-like hydrolase/transferase [Carboxylicivirga mesophila]